MTKGLYSTKEVAELTGLTDISIRSYIRRGQIKAEKFNGVYMVTQKDLDKWLNVRRSKPGNRRKTK